MKPRRNASVSPILLWAVQNLFFFFCKLSHPLLCKHNSLTTTL